LSHDKTACYEARNVVLEVFYENDKLVQAWIEIHKEDLMADWKLAVAGEPIFKIDPLR